MSLTVRDLVGQSVMLSFEGQQATPELLDALTQTRACGVILFARNIAGPEQLNELNQTLQAHAAAVGLPPLLISIDQEGGIVSRLPAPFVTVPSQMAQAATGDVQAAYSCARITGQQLRSCGVNTNFAPVLDVNNNPDNPVIGTRSFGSEPARVAAFGLAALRGYANAGVIATVKHFPGHGDTHVDSHLGLPRVAHSRSRCTAVEFAPFVAAFGAHVPAVMSAHIIFEALDDVPATLSHTILTELLRNELGYQGLVFTDALDMRAIADLYGPVEAALRSKAAGADVLLPLGSLESQINVASALRAAVERGTLDPSRFRQTAERLAYVRLAYNLSHTLPPPLLLDPALEQEALEIARRGVTLVQHYACLPLPADVRVALIDCLLPRFSLVEEAVEAAEALRALVADRFSPLQHLVVGPEPTDDDIKQAVGLAQYADAVVFVTRNATHFPEQVELGRALCAAGLPVVHVAARSPYDAGLVADAAAVVVLYGDPPVSQRALAELLATHTHAYGQLPVELPGFAEGAQRAW